MIRKLQKRFIRIAMCSMAGVLLVVVMAVNTVNFWNSMRGIEEQLNQIVDYEYDSRWMDETKPLFLGIPADSEESYRTRYFIVQIDSDGEYTYNIENIAAVDEDGAKAYARKVLARDKESGSIQRYRFRMVKNEESVAVIFIDYGPEIRQFLVLTVIGVAIILFNLFLLYFPIRIFSARALRPVEESFIRQKQFVTDAGHEIKTPLAIISANTDVLALTGEENEWIKSIRNQVARLSQLASDLSALARMDEEEFPGIVEEVSLSDVVQESASPFCSLAAAQQKTFAMHIQPELRMNGNEHTIRQLVAILCDNAVKHSTGNGEIVLRLAESGKQVALEIENRCELPEETDLSRLFDRFYRADPSRARQTGGSGLGLAIALRIVEQHRGTIFATLENGGKIRFVALFPA